MDHPLEVPRRCGGTAPVPQSASRAQLRLAPLRDQPGANPRDGQRMRSRRGRRAFRRGRPQTTVRPFSAARLTPTTPVPMHDLGSQKIPEDTYEVFVLGGVVSFAVLLFLCPFAKPCKRFCETRLHRVRRMCHFAASLVGGVGSSGAHVRRQAPSVQKASGLPLASRRMASTSPRAIASICWYCWCGDRQSSRRRA